MYSLPSFEQAYKILKCIEGLYYNALFVHFKGEARTNKRFLMRRLRFYCSTCPYVLIKLSKI